ncbi:MAG: glycosyltransferase, partial [Nostocaceae cyanobacterium]|nr:glycosyltransferase [Nostocaceae cyanobacterium]
NVVIEQRYQWKLPPYIHWEDSGSPLAQICQLPPEFDFPRVNLPQWFHYTGPLQDPSGSELISFPSLSFPFAPQQQLIQRSALTITHAGMNTVLGALSSGVPLVAIPITSEQPGIAARLARTGAGEVIPLSRLSVPKLRAVIQQVLTEDSYKQNAVRLQQAIHKAGGVSRAADIIEKAVSTSKPVLSSQL